MLDTYLVRHGAPTLAGLKTGCIFPCPYTSPQALTAELRQTNLQLRAKGLRLIPLRLSARRALIYVYRPARLSADLSDSRAAGLLLHFGYCAVSSDACVVELARRLRQQADFPHEIGLFLGYPPEDVSGFITHHARCYKCVGCWKVYGDVEAARKIFAQYEACTRIYCQRWACGVSLEHLAVAG